MRIVHHLSFGSEGNARGWLRQGWSDDEKIFTWSAGESCSFELPCPSGLGSLALELETGPYIQLPFVPSQRLGVTIGTSPAGTTRIDGGATLCFDVPQDAKRDAGKLLVEITTPDAASPASLKAGEDQRRLALMLRHVRLLETPPAPSILPCSLAPLRISEPTPEALDSSVRARIGLGTHDLLRGFESLGHNCEFGLMQRDLDTEPLGLLRFGGIEPASLLRGLACGFAGIEDAGGLSLESGRMNGRLEYLVRDARFGVRMHTGQFLDDVLPEAVDMNRMARHVAFLQRQFAAVLREASRIFVLHHPGLHDYAHARPILNRLRCHGSNALLYVTEHPTVPPGTVVIEGAHLYHGYIDRLVPMKEAKNINLGAWVSLCANAYTAVKRQMSLAP